MTSLALLPGRAVLALGGADRVSFLDGLASNDVSAAAPGCAVWAALLTPQGKYLADFFIFSDGDRLFLDAEADAAEDLARRLARFRLRADVTITAVPLHVHAAWGGARPETPQGALIAPDPRLQEAGWRILSPEPLPASATPDTYDAHRLALGLPDGARDLERDKTILLEAGFDELNGVSWTKGCYMGQELTARTRYRGLLKRRLLPVTTPAGALPAPGTPVIAEGGREAGTLRSVRGNEGLAVLRLDLLSVPLEAGGVSLTPRIPAWARLPEPA